MEEPEVPIEQLQEEIHHCVEAGGRWILGVALSSALLASLAAVASLQAGHSSNEAMISQIESANQWSHFQSKSIKEAQLKSKMEILEALGKPPTDADRAKSMDYEKEKEQIQQEADQSQREARHHLRMHHVLSRSVTMFQVAIALGAISVLTRRRKYWMISLGFGGVGLFFVVQSFVTILSR
jgi:lipopolysaccharide export LptBFGC system permease protein LptF